jgi:hypothetical protein
LDPDPQTGILMKATTTSDTHGYYEFGDIPFGVRSIVMEPKLVYALDSGVSFDDDDDDHHHHHHGTNIKFRVANYSLSVVDIVGVTVYYDTMPAAYFSEMEIGDTVVFKATGPDFARKGSGEPVSVSPPIGVAGTSSPFTPMVVHVDSVKTRVSDLTIDSSESGASVQIEIKRFRDARWQGGQPVDVTGVQFTVVFQHSDGSASTVTFTPTRGED